DLVAQPAEKRDKKLLAKLQAHHRSLSESWKKLDAEVKELSAKASQLGTTTPILRELKQPRVTHIQIRGNFLDKGEQVSPGLPAAFPAPVVEGSGDPSTAPVINRLTLARWLVSPDNPLTARVAVNRLWEEIFGAGIVLTSEDFGVKGEPPSHPELL